MLELVALGLSDSEMADQLVIEELTVKTHVKRILMKLDLRDPIRMMISATRAG